MNKRFLTSLGCVVLTVAVSGCATTASKPAVTTRAYLEERERVDQDMVEGEHNFGYIFGTPKPEDRSKYKKTRQMYVLEVTKEDPADATTDSEVVIPPPLPPTPRRDYDIPEPRRERRPEPKPDLVLPPIDDLPPLREEPVEAVVTKVEACTPYTVQSGDTLQKISKKFYDTYKKWKPIYEANKNVIPDPNVLKVGMQLCIPGAGAPLGENLK